LPPISWRIARSWLPPLCDRQSSTGQPIPVNAIRDPYLVNQGKSSLVVFETSGLVITMQAIALQNGIAGDVVTLRNPDSGVVIQGTVERDGSVRLGAP
jgi:flagella basal body P-ring formation protein FlgA